MPVYSKIAALKFKSGGSMKKLLVILLGFFFALPAFAGNIAAVSNEAWLDHVAQMQSLRQQILSLVTKANPTAEDRQNLEQLNQTFAEKQSAWEKYLEEAAQNQQQKIEETEKAKADGKACHKKWSRYNKHARKHHRCHGCKEEGKKECAHRKCGDKKNNCGDKQPCLERCEEKSGECGKMEGRHAGKKCCKKHSKSHCGKHKAMKGKCADKCKDSAKAECKDKACGSEKSKAGCKDMNCCKEEAKATCKSKNCGESSDKEKTKSPCGDKNFGGCESKAGCNDNSCGSEKPQTGCSDKGCKDISCAESK